MNALPDCGVGSALRRLRTLGSLETLFREAVHALCENLGFDRAAVFSARGRTLTLESVHGRDLNPQELAELTALATDPPPLGPGLHESEVLRRQRAVLVEDALGDPRALGLLPGASAFVAAPVVCHERPVALMHADLGASGQILTEYDRRRSGRSPRASVARSSAACSQAGSASSPRAWWRSPGQPRRAWWPSAGPR